MSCLKTFLLCFILVSLSDALDEPEHEENGAHSVIDNPEFSVFEPMDWILELNDTINVQCPVATKILVTINKNPISIYERNESGIYKRVIDESFARVASFDGAEPAPRVVVQVRASGTIRCFDFDTTDHISTTVALYDKIYGRQDLVVDGERHYVKDKATAVLDKRETVIAEFTVSSLLGREPSCASNITSGASRKKAPLVYSRVTKTDHQTIYEAPLWREDNSSLIFITTCCNVSYGNRFCMQLSMQTEDKIIYIPALSLDHMGHTQTEYDLNISEAFSFSPPNQTQEFFDNNSHLLCNQNGTFNEHHADKNLDLKKGSIEIDESDAVLAATLIGAASLILVGITMISTCCCLQAKKRLRETAEEKNT